MRALVGALLFALAFADPASAQRLLSPSEFRDAAVAMIRAADPRAEIEPRGDLGVNIRRPHDKEQPESWVNFDEAYRQYQADPAALNDILARWAGMTTHPLENSQMADRVVAIVRSRAVMEQLAAESAQARARSDHAPADLLWRPLAGDLAEVLAFDGADTIQYAMEDALADLGLSVEQAWAAAPRNLPARLGQLDVSGVEGADRILYVTGGNGLAPSTLLEGGVCAGDEMRNYVFLVVDRNGYLAGDRSDSVAMRQFRDLIDELRRSGGSMSLTPLGCHDGGVVEIMLTD